MNRTKFINLLYALIGIGLIVVAIKIYQSIFASQNSLFVYIELIWLVVALYFLFVLRKLCALKIIMICISSVFFGLILAEGFLLLNNENTGDDRNEVRFVFDTNVQAHRKHEFLGALPLENNKYSRAKYYRDQLIYDVTYTIGEHGMRVSPPVSHEKILGDVIFFGCSFTYGEGVQDYETMPYQVGVLSGGKYNIFNMGFSGYGPHQMLSALEHGRVVDIVGINVVPKIFIYHSIYDQIRRATRPQFWDYYAPRYVLNRYGEVEYTGSFLDNSILSFTMIGQLRKSIIYTKIFEEDRKVSNKNIDLFLKIISKSIDKVEEIFPGSEFHIIHWDNEFIHQEQTVLTGFKTHSLDVHLISAIINNYKKSKKLYHISAHDPHPNARAYKIIAKYITDNILTTSDSKIE